MNVFIRRNQLVLLVLLIAISSYFCQPASRQHRDEWDAQVSEKVSAQTPRSTAPQRQPLAFKQTGLASFMADELHGKRTASGEIYNMRLLVAAHPTLPFGSRVRVTNLTNGKSVVVRITDRGPFVDKRIIDVSLQAAKELDFVEKGVEQVEIQVLQTP